MAIELPTRKVLAAMSLRKRSAAGALDVDFCGGALYCLSGEGDVYKHEQCRLLANTGQQAAGVHTMRIVDSSSDVVALFSYTACYVYAENRLKLRIAFDNVSQLLAFSDDEDTAVKV